MKSLIIMINLLLLAGCSAKKDPPPPNYPVAIEDVKVEDVPYFIKGIGQLTASVSVDVKAQVEGLLTHVHFIDGELVEEGATLMTIDPRLYEAQVEEARAKLALCQAHHRYALDFANAYGSLVGNEYVSRLDYEEGKKNVDVHKASIESALALVKQAELNLSYTQIKAPIRGYVGGRKYDPGNVVYPRIDGTLATINKITPITLNFSLPGEHIFEIRERQKEGPLYIEAILPEDPSRPLQGHLYFIDNKVNLQTGMVFLKASFPNVEERGWPGAFARAKLRLKVLNNSVLVPQNAVVQGHNGNFVYVVDKEKMTVQMRMIGKGIEYKNYFVATWGLNPDETVVTDGQLNLCNGASVFVPKVKL